MPVRYTSCQYYCSCYFFSTKNLARRQVHFHELSDGMADAKSGVDVDDPAYLKAKIKELVGILRPLMAVTQKREGGAADA